LRSPLSPWRGIKTKIAALFPWRGIKTKIAALFPWRGIRIKIAALSLGERGDRKAVGEGSLRG
jgi:hypothetical protein